MMKEFRGCKSNVDYENIFNNLDDDIKFDLEVLTEYYFSEFFNNSSTTNLIAKTVSIPNVKTVNNLPVKLKLYFMKDITFLTSGSTYRLGININLLPFEHIDYKNSDLLQDVYILSKELNTNLMYNILFYGHLFMQKFEYNPILKYLHHEDDVEDLALLKESHLRLFNETNECVVCSEQTITKTDCNHYLCQQCFSLLKKKTCPMCRENLCPNDIILDFL